MRRCSAPRTKTAAAGSATARSRTALAPANDLGPVPAGQLHRRLVDGERGPAAGLQSRREACITSKSQWTIARSLSSAISVTAPQPPRSSSSHRVGTTSIPAASAASASGPGGPSIVASPPASTWRPSRRTHCQVEPPGSRLCSRQQTLSTPNSPPAAIGWNNRTLARAEPLGPRPQSARRRGCRDRRRRRDRRQRRHPRRGQRSRTGARIDNGAVLGRIAPSPTAARRRAVPSAARP